MTSTSDLVGIDFDIHPDPADEAQDEVHHAEVEDEVQDEAPDGEVEDEVHDSDAGDASSDGDPSSPTTTHSTYSPPLSLSFDDFSEDFDGDAYVVGGTVDERHESMEEVDFEDAEIGGLADRDGGGEFGDQLLIAGDPSLVPGG